MQNRHEGPASDNHYTYCRLYPDSDWFVLLFLFWKRVGSLTTKKIPSGIFSMNVTVPHNTRHPGGRYVGFSLVLTGAAAIITSMFLLVRYWWKTARRRQGPPL